MDDLDWCLLVLFYHFQLSVEQQRAAESLYRDANTLLYADNKPSEDAIDRVIGKLNIEYVLLSSCFLLNTNSHFLESTHSQDKRNKFSRKRLNEDEGDITYINERNRVFNKKVRPRYHKFSVHCFSLTLLFSPDCALLR